MAVGGGLGFPGQICLPAKVQETDRVRPRGPRTFWEQGWFYGCGLCGHKGWGGSIIRKPWGLVSCSAVTVVRLLIIF